MNSLMLQHVPRGKKVFVSTHNHFLLLSSKEERNYPNDSVWICDLCKVYSSSYVYSFLCQQCNYDACLNCFKEKFVIREEKKENKGKKLNNECCNIF